MGLRHLAVTERPSAISGTTGNIAQLTERHSAIWTDRADIPLRTVTVI